MCRTGQVTSWWRGRELKRNLLKLRKGHKGCNLSSETDRENNFCLPHSRHTEVVTLPEDDGLDCKGYNDPLLEMLTAVII